MVGEINEEHWQNWVMDNLDNKICREGVAYHLLPRLISSLHHWKS